MTLAWSSTLLTCLTSPLVVQEKLSDYFELTTKQTVFQTIQALGVGEVKGFRFRILPPSPGRLPRVLAFPGAEIDSPVLCLFKLDGKGTWRWYFEWHMRSQSEGSAPLLEPGDYLLRANIPDAVDTSQLVLLTGKWEDAAATSDEWWLKIPEGDVESVVNQRGQRLTGIKFSIEPRSDGALPAIRRISFSFGDSNWESVRVYRKISDGVYSIHLISATQLGTPGHGTVLRPGDYLFQVPLSVPYWEPYRQTRLASGLWIKP